MNPGPEATCSVPRNWSSSNTWPGQWHSIWILLIWAWPKIAQLYQTRDCVLRVKKSSMKEMQLFYLGLKLILKILKVTFANQWLGWICSLLSLIILHLYCRHIKDALSGLLSWETVQVCLPQIVSQSLLLNSSCTFARLTSFWTASCPAGRVSFSLLFCEVLTLSCSKCYLLRYY